MKSNDAQHSQEMRELLTLIPNWSVRWAVLFEAVALALVVIVLAVLKTPNALLSTVTLVGKNPAVSVVAKSDGRIEFFVKDKQTVNIGDKLAVVENPAVWNDVDTLDRLLPAFQPCISGQDTMRCRKLSPSIANLHLGDLQPDCSTFVRAIAAWADLIDDRSSEQQAELLRSQIRISQFERARLERQHELFERQEKYEEANVSRTTLLAEQNLVPKSEVERSRAAVEQRKIATEEAKYRMLENDMKSADTERSLKELSQRTQEARTISKLALEESYRTINAKLESWKARYLYTSPVQGNILLFKFWTSGEVIKSGEELLAVVPARYAEGMAGRMYVVQDRMAKVRPGQLVRIDLANFPPDEFGTLPGIVESVSEVPRENRYIVNVSLPVPATTTYGKTISLHEGMEGSGSIMLDEESVLRRILNSARLFIANQKSTGN